MTPEQKAKELIDKFQKEIPDYLYQGKMLDMAAKACAVIFCDEMLDTLNMLHKPEYTTFFITLSDPAKPNADGYELFEYWQQVKSLLSNGQNPERGVTRDDASSNAAGSKTKS